MTSDGLGGRDRREPASESESESDEKPAEVTAEAEEPESTADEPEPASEDEASDTGEPESTNGNWVTTAVRQGSHSPAQALARRRRCRGLATSRLGRSLNKLWTWPLVVLLGLALMSCRVRRTGASRRARVHPE